MEPEARTGNWSFEEDRGPLAEKPDFTERELLVKGPEKDCLFSFL